MGWLAKWYHRPEDYRLDRWLFLRNGWFVIAVISVTLGILTNVTHISDNRYFLPIYLGIFVMAYLVNYIRFRNPKSVQWNQDWFRGKYSRWAIWWRG